MARRLNLDPPISGQIAQLGPEELPNRLGKGDTAVCWHPLN